MDLLDLNENGPKNNKRYRYNSVVNNNFSKLRKLRWTVSMKNDVLEKQKTQCFQFSFLQKENQLCLSVMMERNL